MDTIKHSSSTKSLWQKFQLPTPHRPLPVGSASCGGSCSLVQVLVFPPAGPSAGNSACHVVAFHNYKLNTLWAGHYRISKYCAYTMIAQGASFEMPYWESVMANEDLVLNNDLPLLCHLPPPLTPLRWVEGLSCCLDWSVTLRPTFAHFVYWFPCCFDPNLDVSWFILLVFLDHVLQWLLRKISSTCLF